MPKNDYDCLNLGAARSTLNVPIQPDNRTGLYLCMEFFIRNETVPVGVSEYVKVPVSAFFTFFKMSYLRQFSS